MAFDRTDTDRLYDRVIRPVLRANAIIPVIINRRQSNQDLNNQIVEQLESCDFCIADLTYTRPSVYFEAGYAQRAIPVIYTVRADHLARNQPDDLCVHFDLQMKPLIRWRQPLDPDFRAGLVRRLRSTVLRDWARAQQAIDVRNDGRKAFASESVSRRLAIMRHEAMLAFRRFGLWRWALQQHPNAFAPAPGAWGRAGSTSVRWAVAPRLAVKYALESAWTRRAPKRLHAKGSSQGFTEGPSPRRPRA